MSTLDEIDESYDDTLKAKTVENIDRTKLWLYAQNIYMQAICEDDEDLEEFATVQDAVPATPELASPNESSPTSLKSSPSKKSVRFVADVIAQTEKSASPENKRVSPIHDGTFWQGWRYHKRSEF